MRVGAGIFLLVTSGLWMGGSGASGAAEVRIGERPAVERHLDQADIEAGKIGLQEVLEHGRRLFVARFNVLDGQGRPASTGTGGKRVASQPPFIRTSAPESNSCAGCHSQPRVGGAGDFVANVFVLAQALDPVTESVSPSLSNERNTLGMFGSGAIEMLAREMSGELVGIREAARSEAMASGRAVTRPLVAKGVTFGELTVLPSGLVDPGGIEGVDWDLIVKPFHQKGAVVSLREFSNNAMNHHHGMQSVERFGEGEDPDEDGVRNELSVGDMTALALYQATLPPPTRERSGEPARRRAASVGEALFRRVGCTSCHIPSMVLDSRTFSEPGPYNPAGNLRIEDVARPVEIDLLRGGASSLLEPLAGGRLRIRAFTDLKRHDLNDAELDHFANEMLPQGTLAGFADPAEFTVAPEPRGPREFLTRKLWDVGNSDPYGHRGDLTTLTESIYWHGGEARAARDAFLQLPPADRGAIIEFLKTLRVPSVPDRPVRRSSERSGSSG